jgi:hypothetical protein
VAGAAAPALAEQELIRGRYRLLARLGAGGFGVVWRARDELLHREVALKRIALPTAADRERATREALASARLAHPAIVALYEACADERDFYLVSELVHGPTLAEALAADALSDEQLLEIGIALCDALAHAHARGVVHRDVKPQNVLLPAHSEDPSARGGGAPAKLADFGGAQLAGEDALTRTGDVLGTLAYMAPEQCEGRAAGAPADLYALALVLYEALSGVNPVRAATPAATVRRIGTRLPALARARPDLPRALTGALDAALAPDPRQRGTLEDLQDALGQALADGLRPQPRFAARRRADWLTAERLAWLLGASGLCAWQIGAGRAGVALLLVCAVLPLVVCVRRPGPLWLAAVAAPLLGTIGLAGAFPALAAQAPRWRERALLAMLGYWWLALAEPLLDTPARRLWLGVPTAAGGHPSGLAWESSPTAAAAHALNPLLTLALPAAALVWALAALLLPVLVRGTSAARDAVAATAWAVLLASGTPAAIVALGGGSPRGALLGAACGAVLAILLRAVCARPLAADAQVG